MFALARVLAHSAKDGVEASGRACERVERKRMVVEHSYSHGGVNKVVTTTPEPKTNTEEAKKETVA